MLIDHDWIHKEDEAGNRLLESESDYCRQELQRALTRRSQKERLELLPILHSKVSALERHHLPPQLLSLLDLRWLRWDEGRKYQDCVKEVVDWLRGRIGLSKQDLDHISSPSWKESNGINSPVPNGVKSVVSTVVSPRHPDVQLRTGDADAVNHSSALVSALRSCDAAAVGRHRSALLEWLESNEDRQDHLIILVRELLADAEDGLRRHGMESRLRQGLGDIDQT